MSQASAHVLVTGGAGYIGSHVCKALADAGYTPVALDDLSQGQEWAVKWGPLVKGDLLDNELVRSVFEKYKPVGIMHLAGKIAVGESVTKPIDYYRANVSASLELFKINLEFSGAPIIFSSTAAVYGNAPQRPIVESDPLEPLSPYAKNKLMVENILADLERAHGTRFIALRFFNAAGADFAAGLREAHNPETHLIPIALEVATGRRPELALYGDDYPTSDGTCLRDYIHVSDLAAAHILSLQHLLAKKESGVFNLGTRQGYSVKDVIRACEQATAKKITYRIAPRRPGDAPVLLADANLAKKKLGWETRHSDLQTIVTSAWKSMKS